jgi:rubrerythrin
MTDDLNNLISNLRNTIPKIEKYERRIEVAKELKDKGEDEKTICDLVIKDYEKEISSIIEGVMNDIKPLEEYERKLRENKNNLELEKRKKELKHKVARIVNDDPSEIQQLQIEIQNIEKEITNHNNNLTDIQQILNKLRPYIPDQCTHPNKIAVPIYGYHDTGTLYRCPNCGKSWRE